MVIDRQTFTYQDKKIIEKVIFRTPFRLDTIFKNQGCFLYFKNPGVKILSSEDNDEIKKNEALLLRCGSYFIDFIHRNTDQVEVIAVHLYPDILKKLYIDELPALIEQRNYNKKSGFIADNLILSKYIESLEFYFENPLLVNEDLLALKIKELILLLVQTENVTSVLELVSDLMSTKETSIRRVIDLHLFSDISITDLATLCNMSLSSFKRNFKKEFNESPNSYIINKRLEKAKSLLQITDTAIGEIAYDLGFNDPHYFTRIFKKKIGMSPSAYRKSKV